MNYLIITTGILIIISKLFDVLSTIKVVSSPYQEKNLFARKIMLKIGIKSTCWLIFLLVVIFVSIYTYNIFLSDKIWIIIGFIIFGNIITVIQFAVAHYNYTRRKNLIIKLLTKTAIYK